MMVVWVMKGNRRRADSGTCLCFQGGGLVSTGRKGEFTQNWLRCRIGNLQNGEGNRFIHSSLVIMQLTIN